MSGILSRLARCRSGAGAAEFALVLPLLLLFLFGIIDVGRVMWMWNRAEKATQMGARYAVATNMVPAGLYSYSFSTQGGIPQGDPIPEGSFGGATCTSAGCNCDTGKTCPPLGTASVTAFADIVQRMHYFLPDIQAANVVVQYGYSGLGYAGDPNGSDVAPLVTVSLTGLTFRPITFLAFTTIPLPDFRAALTLEDGEGTFSN